MTFFNTLREAVARFMAPKDEFGLTPAEASNIVSWAAESERGHDMAQRVAVIGHGLSIDQFDQLLKLHGVELR
ncbi:hypothetical protein [Duganella vulcania]|uniref:Uncharacterized protein n=1 Tax=Duganella vulcania TaxID=2692166 RepID=A0A845GH90_9BURK|nr:hypothetical protein [Duganella vulcania]MYM92378.1 hypothetical protein [Duganella vulcania]